MAVPFGFSILDIAKAIQLSREIYIKCFAEGRQANVKYREFINDINALGTSLKRLQDVVKRHEAQYPRREWHCDSIFAADNMWPQLTGDFYQTLQECDSLLSRHSRLRNGGTTLSSNLRWWLSAEGARDNLMARLKFHITKVDFYARPSEFDSIVKNGSQIQQLRRQVANIERLMMNGAGPSQKTWMDFVSNELIAKFQSEFNSNRPSWVLEGLEWPLREGFEALAFHFARGTVKFNPTPDLGKIPDLAQYLNLAKSIWILEQIRQSCHFRAASTESVWADYMRELEDDLRGQLHRFETGELNKPVAQNLLELPGKSYSIMKGEKTDPDLDPLDAGKAGPLEEKILEIKLSSDSSNHESALLVFRENDNDFRLVTSTKQADTVMAQYDKEVEVNMDRNRLVPAYGNPTQNFSLRHNLLLFNEKGKKPKEFVFPDVEDVKKLQRALTGYRVHHNMPVARWCINGSNQPGEFGRGSLQLWQFKPLPPMSETSSCQVADAKSLAGSPRSPVPSLSSAKVPPVKHAELTVSERQNGGFINFKDWDGFQDLSNAEVLSRQESWTLSLTETANAQPPGGRRHLSSFPSPTGRSLSKASSLTARSKNGSYEMQNDSPPASNTTLMSRSSVMSPVQGPRSGGTEFSKPELPVLVIFTLLNQKYSFLHLTLDASIYVEPKSCGCRIPKQRCNRVILESTKKSFTTRTLSASQEGDGGLDSWDLSVFRYPRSEKLKKTTINERVKTLELRFEDEDEKNEFLKELTSLENNRTTNHNDYEKSLRGKKKRAKS